jgi:hypothetical protein
LTREATGGAAEMQISYVEGDLLTMLTRLCPPPAASE